MLKCSFIWSKVGALNFAKFGYFLLKFREKYYAKITINLSVTFYYSIYFKIFFKIHSQCRLWIHVKSTCPHCA